LQAATRIRCTAIWTSCAGADAAVLPSRRRDGALRVLDDARAAKSEEATTGRRVHDQPRRLIVRSPHHRDHPPRSTRSKRDLVTGLPVRDARYERAKIHVIRTNQPKLRHPGTLLSRGRTASRTRRERRLRLPKTVLTRRPIEAAGFDGELGDGAAVSRDQVEQIVFLVELPLVLEPVVQITNRLERIVQRAEADRDVVGHHTTVSDQGRCGLIAARVAMIRPGSRGVPDLRA